MNISGSQVKPHELPPITDQGQLTEGVEAIKTEAPVCSEAAREFPELTDTEALTQTAKVVAEGLKGSEGGLNDWDLPCNLTPIHIACLARDRELLESTLEDERSSDWMNQHTSSTAADGENPAVGDKQPLAMNHDTPLHFALLTGWNEGASKLIDKLITREQLENTVNNSGNSLLSLAAGHSSLDVLQALCAHFRESDDYHAHLFHKSADQRSLLHHAVQQDDTKIFQYLEHEQFCASEKVIKGSVSDQDSLIYPKTTNGDQDMNGKKPADLIKDKVGALYVQNLHDNPQLVEQKRYQGCANPWEHHYLQETTGLMDPISWVPPWERVKLKCVIV